MSDFRQNLLLAALSATQLRRLAPHLEAIEMPLGGVLYESGRQPGYVYFPTSSIISLLYVLESGASSQLAVVGNDGVIGVSLFMGGETTPSRAVVQSAGVGYRLAARRIKSEFTRGGPLQQLMLRYTQSLITQMAQTAVCNRHHSVDQQLARWLLHSIDRLGVRREGVTEAAGKLQKAGVISYRRGQISVLDRANLEKLSCECYEVVRIETARLLPWVPPH